MTGDRARLINFVEKFIGTVRFGNDEYAAIVGYGDYKLGDTIISRVYYVEGLKHNLFSVGQFCDGGLEVAFRQHSCHIRNYDMVDLLNGSRTTNLYSISLNDMMSAFTVCLLHKPLQRSHETDYGTEFVNKTLEGLAPQQMTYVPNSTELELTALQSGRSRSALVKDPEPPSVPPTKKQVDDLFQWFDYDEVIPPPIVPIPPVNVHAAPAPENANGTTSDSDIETLFDHVNSNVFDTYNAPESDSEVSSSNSVNIDVTPNNQIEAIRLFIALEASQNMVIFMIGRETALPHRRSE
ncbi:hypothetical protein Tco_0510597 [Tanacetum coccineum]